MAPTFEALKKRLVEYPLVTARELATQTGASIGEIRDFFKQVRRDPQMQQDLRSWGPGKGYAFRVLMSILQIPEFPKSVLDNVPVFPTVLELHPGPTCPCACIFCYSRGRTRLGGECDGYRPGPHDQLLDSDQILSVVATAVGSGCKAIYLSGGLEPFTSRAIADVVKGLPEEPDLRVYTNGVPDTLSDELLERVVGRASQLRFSVHAATAETYANVQMPHRSDGEEVFRRVVGRVRTAVEIRDRLDECEGSATQIGVAFLTVPENYHELERAVDLWHEVGIDFFDISNDALREDPRTTTLAEQQMAELRRALDPIHKPIARDQSPGSQSDARRKLDIRPSREDAQLVLKRPKRCYAPLYKAVIDPYGGLWTCCMRAHPGCQHGNFYLDTVASGHELAGHIERRHALPLGRRKVPIYPHCRECTEYEYAANCWIEKLLEDLEVGISVDEQPFVLS